MALDHLGRKLDVLEVPTTTKGYRQLLEWAESFGDVEAWGVEGTGCFGAGLTRFLAAEGHLVIEVIRPKRQTRRLKGKSDPTDAEAAARAVLAGEAAAVPKAGTDRVEMIRVLRVARASAMKARTQGHQHPPSLGHHRPAGTPRPSPGPLHRRPHPHRRPAPPWR